jgi:20S proteasome subunit alpha 6
MQKSLYDQSTLTWSPQGRLYQVEYAMEAVNQGNLLIGVRSNTHVVLVGFKTAPHEKLSYYPEKLFKVSNHIGMGIAGLTPDGRLLYQYLKNQCLNYNFTFNSDYPIEKLINKIGEKSQIKTQRGESKRPYGVGLLIAGYDRTGPRLFRTCPSANFYEYKCVAIGSRCQTANSFLENNLEKLSDMNKDALIKIALEATKKAEDVKINGNNIDVIIVGKDETTKLLSVDEINHYLNEIDNKMDLL